MAAVLPRYQEGPVTFQVSTTVTGGQLVESDGGNPAMVRPASANSATCVGVSTLDAVPSGTSQSGTFPDVPSNLAVNAAPFSPYTSVASDGVYPVTYAAAATFMQRLKCAANGQVTPWVSGTDNPALIVGICYEPAGVAAAGVGAMQIVNLS